MRPSRPDLLVAAALLVAGLAEVALGPDEGRIVRAVAVPVGTAALAWRRVLPVGSLVVVAGAFAVQCAAGHLFDGHPVVPLVVLVVALFSAGRHARSLIFPVVIAAALTAVRVAFDPAVGSAPDGVLSFAVALLPLLLGRWVRGQEQLRLELRSRAERLERERRRDARAAAEEERMRIASDLQSAATGALEAIARDTREVAALLRADERERAGELLARVAATARAALADVRRVLGILRREAEEPVTAASVAVGPAARYPALPAWLLPLGVFVGGAVELGVPLGAVTAALVAAPLVLRTRVPLVCAAGVMAAIALQSVLLDPDAFPAASIVAVVCASYAIGSHAGGAGVAGLVGMAAASLAHAAIVHPDGVAPALIGGVLVPWTAGRIRRGQRALMREAEAKAADLERARERDARAAVTAERMRVARELHDAVAHNISVIAIQAAGAHGVVERDPARAADVVALIGDVVGEALTELQGLAVGEPQVGLAGVDALAQRARDGGLPVELRVEGEAAEPLPAGVDVAAFRIVQEALANTSKHAGRATARVVVRYAGRAVELEIDDDGRGPNGRGSGSGSGSGPGPGSPGEGHGLIGMRERVALYGGTLEVGRRASGGFAVRARLPIGGT